MNLSRKIKIRKVGRSAKIDGIQEKWLGFVVIMLFLITFFVVIGDMCQHAVTFIASKT